MAQAQLQQKDPKDMTHDELLDAIFACFDRLLEEAARGPLR